MKFMWKLYERFDFWKSCKNFLFMKLCEVLCVMEIIWELCFVKVMLNVGFIKDLFRIKKNILNSYWAITLIITIPQVWIRSNWLDPSSNDLPKQLLNKPSWLLECIIVLENISRTYHYKLQLKLENNSYVNFYIGIVKKTYLFIIQLSP